MVILMVSISVQQLCQMDDQSRGTLPPHVFPLMVVHFLQQHNPPVLPVLHSLHPKPDGDVYLRECTLRLSLWKHKIFFVWNLSTSKMFMCISMWSCLVWFQVHQNLVINGSAKTPRVWVDYGLTCSVSIPLASRWQTLSSMWDSCSLCPEQRKHGAKK